MQDSRRALITEKVTKAAVGHFVKKRYAVYKELGLNKRAKLRADLVCFNYKQEILVVEIKSSLADFKADKKWEGYLEYCDKLYFVFYEDTYLKNKDLYRSKLAGKAGILVLSPTTGLLRSVMPAKLLDLDSSVRFKLIIRMAYRADFTKRNTKRYKVFL